MEAERCRFFIQAKSPDLFPPVLCDATGKSTLETMRAECPMKQLTDSRCFFLDTTQVNKRIRPQPVVSKNNSGRRPISSI